MACLLPHFIVLSLGAVLVACSPRSPDAPAATTTPANAPTRATSPQVPVTAAVPPPDFTALVERVGPAVVNVTTSGTGGAPAGAAPPVPPDDPLFDFFRRFMPPDPGGAEPQEFRSRGVGSGFIIDAQGLVLTNAHVVAGADEVTVRLADNKREYRAKVVGNDPQTDVALLKVDAPQLPAAPLGDSTRLKAGEWVAAIGSPFGFANTITAGIVSATERTLPDETYVPFIQTDVAVNPGNSGGPLLNTRGEVVGINSQIYSRTGGYMGVSFAIPIAVAMDIAQQLRTDGHVTRGRLGVGIQEVTSQLAQSFKLKDARGALVTTVEPDGPADKAGIAAGDVILRFAGQEVADATALPRLVAQTKPGTTVDVEVWRGGASRTLKATVGAAPVPQEAKRTLPSSQPGQQSSGRLGLMVSELPPAGRRALGVDYGLVVDGVRGPNADAPLQQGDVIVAVNSQRFKSLEEFNRHLAQAAPGDTVALLVRRGDASLYVPVTVADS
ncbi:DegQ family serine endoprotease [Aquabacterium sp. A7-Y]|uniref:DegQ family serine endoprotease n=1 Tax=Aquabacterium sp. A7-Y TaxID=1349605 RepID=UPI00223E5054|nr:DegQ family serine endoprotease [Aquabacterium sp. A7-Y]MCW7541753.1 DegQ family serine endoprotease [Aquabacterium sp. A7-Y]